MLYEFKDGYTYPQSRIKNIQTIYTDTTFTDENFIDMRGLNNDETSKTLGDELYCLLETEEDIGNIYHNHIFFNLDNGDSYEVILKRRN